MYDNDPVFGDIKEKHNDRCIIDYINRLYLIELLKEVDVSHISDQLANQYGTVFQTAWKDSDRLIHKFTETHKFELMKFIVLKINKVVRKLSDITLLTSSEYCPTPLTPAEVVSINNATECFGNISHYDNLTSRMIHEQLSALDIPETILKGIFSNFTELHASVKDIQHSKELGPQRAAIISNTGHIYLEHYTDCCLRCLLTDIEEFISPYPKFDSTIEINNAARNIANIAKIYSTIYRLAYPVYIQPDSLDRLYEKYILTSANYTAARNYASDWSGSHASEVICSKLPILSHDYANPSSRITGDGTMFPTENTNPGSLVEKYLVTEYLVEHSFCDCQ